VTGNLETLEYRVEGPVALFYTTTAIDIDEELKNRCITLSVDESRAQTLAIHAQQRYQQTLEGILVNEARQDVVRLHHNAQRLLRPLIVSNPYATEMTFLNDKTRTRRDHMKYLSLINVITLLHQYQREIKRAKNHKGDTLEYIEVSLSDIEAANKLANEVLGRTLDELTPQTRRMLSELQAMVANACQHDRIAQEDYRFSRAQLRHYLGWSYDQVRVHLDRLVAMEYVLVHRGRRGQSYEYELLYRGEGQSGESFLMGLIDVGALRKSAGNPPKSSSTTPTLGGGEAQFGSSLGPHRGAVGVGLGCEKTPINTGSNADLKEKPANSASRKKNNASHRSPDLAAHGRVEI
jgi:hypothetical protein